MRQDSERGMRKTATHQRIPSSRICKLSTRGLSTRTLQHDRLTYGIILRIPTRRTQTDKALPYETWSFCFAYALKVDTASGTWSKCLHSANRYGCDSVTLLIASQLTAKQATERSRRTPADLYSAKLTIHSARNQTSDIRVHEVLIRGFDTP